MSDGKEEVTIPLTLTRSEWCEVVNAIGVRGKHLAFADTAFDEIKCVCIKNWAKELQSAAAKISQACEKNGVMY